MCRAARWTACILLGLMLAGCGPQPVPPDTGAARTVRGFYEALMRKDWRRDYSALHPDSRTHMGPDQFATLAQSYRRQLGFEPVQVHLRSCEEHGNEVLAHVILASQKQAGGRSYKDAVVVRQSSDGWGVVLPARFSQKS